MATLATERLKGIIPFVYAADAGGFTAAAERLNLTSSAVSKSVARLERRLGVVLFERTTRSLALTDAGRAFQETCTRILTELAEAEAVLAAQRREPVGTVRVALPASFGRLRVVPVLSRFSAQYPDVRPQLLFADRFIDLAEEGVDLAVRIGGPPDVPSSLGRRFLGRERLVFCVAPVYLEKNGIPQTIDELQNHACIVYGRPDGTQSPWSYALADGQVGQCVMRPRIVAGDAEAQLAFVRAGLGIAQLATWLVTDDLKAGRLVTILDQTATDGLPLSLLWPVARQLTPKVNVLAQMLEAHLHIR
ncbi:HTH-type transcriptional regulator DmlR [compost metagenome]|uniref:LysR family transcriptional regulator n=1 Tax=Cupriavidus campinensis TaxID=151783 RepID=A0AAE9I2W1_9BURK|nr:MULTISPECIES: LysR family transcriptional regulator [Cupriavidus]TSP12219.1 LysR family transcriptional regulator [Cupriavidus campinensis]URF06129.1 LysR family transcriptional regulator [Cupriavidus campinensis]CAG2129073.1 HTH-type transcriptional regulator DmlR [Cupriavidus campinensis]